MKDLKLVTIIVEWGDFSGVSSWTRLRKFEFNDPIPGLNEAFMVAKHDGKSTGILGNDIEQEVFRALSADSAPKVFEYIKNNILKLLDNPRGTLCRTWIRGLKHWKDKDTNKFLYGLIDKIKAKGINPKENYMDKTKRAQKRLIKTISYVLAARGEKKVIPHIYDDLKFCPGHMGADRLEYLIRPTLAKLAGKDYGPLKADWPTAQELMK